MSRRTRNVGTTRQSVDSMRVTNAIHAICHEPLSLIYVDHINVQCLDTLVHSMNEDGRIIHDPNAPDPLCPCHFHNEDDSDSSATAAAMTSYERDFFSISTAEDAGVANTSGTWLERRVAARVYEQQERGAA